MKRINFILITISLLLQAGILLTACGKDEKEVNSEYDGTRTHQDELIIPDGAEITQDLAWEIVQVRVLNNKLDNIEVYVSKNTILPNTAIDSYYPELAEQSPEFTSWLFFINDVPNANWTHPCRYIYVNVLGGKYEIHQNEMPPRFINTDFIPLVQISIQ